MHQKVVEYFMRQAMHEGRKARAICGDNPPVGCVLVNGIDIIARGHTNQPGQAHAEAMALAQLSGRLSDISAFVTLEPCSFEGRTPSCATALVEAGINRVYVGVIDPDERNNGKGISILQNAGIEVHINVLSAEVRRELFFSPW